MLGSPIKNIKGPEDGDKGQQVNDEGSVLPAILLEFKTSACSCQCILVAPTRECTKLLEWEPGDTGSDLHCSSPS